MKFRVSLVTLVLATTLGARQKIDVFVNNNANVPLWTFAPAKTLASHILASADLDVAWHLGMASARHSQGRIVILDLQAHAPNT